jgi:hypothetical protein
LVDEWPKESAWDFVALGKGHDGEVWAAAKVLREAAGR